MNALLLSAPEICDLQDTKVRLEGEVKRLGEKITQAIQLGIDAGRRECSDEMLGNANIHYADVDTIFCKVMGI